MVLGGRGGGQHFGKLELNVGMFWLGTIVAVFVCLCLYFKRRQKYELKTGIWWGAIFQKTEIECWHVLVGDQCDCQELSHPATDRPSSGWDRPPTTPGNAFF